MNYYSKNIIKALTPYATADAGIISMVLRNLADDIEKNNPGAKELRMWAENNTVKPELKETINLCAVSSLTTDIAGGKDIRKTRSAMAVLLIAGILIANIPGITVTHLFLFYGTLRASTLLPTVMTLKGVRLNAKGIIAGVVTALAVGLPVFAYGSVLNSGPSKIKTYISSI